jgi:hypothetical protein
MDQELLVNEQIAAGATFIRDLNDGIAVSVACWVKPAESYSQYLYIASDDINDANIRDAYGEVARRYQNSRSPWLDLFQIKLINSSDPIARDAMAYRDRFPTTVGMRYPGTSIGGLGIDEAYIYPPMPALVAAP